MVQEYLIVELNQVLDQIVLIPKGSTYYTWGFAFGPSFKSLAYPKRSQLTQSGFLSQLYDLQDSCSNLTCENLEEVHSELEDFKSEVETLRDEQEEKRENMPYQLQEAPVGELLQERYDGLEELYNELDSIDCDSSLDDDSSEEDIENEVSEKISEIQEAFDNCQL